MEAENGEEALALARQHRLMAVRCHDAQTRWHRGVQVLADRRLLSHPVFDKQNDGEDREGFMVVMITASHSTLKN